MSHMSCIGFAVADQEEFMANIDRIFDLAVEDAPASPSTRHVRWSDASGASLAIHVADERVIECVTPFFAAREPARWRVRTSAPADDRGCAHCGGADCDVVDETGALVTRTTVQWLHYQAYRAWLREPRDFAVEVVAFAERAAFYGSTEAFEAAQESWWPGLAEAKDVRGFAEVSFLPEGIFDDSGDIGARATAMFAGRVESAESLVNGMTGQTFWHVRVRSLPGLVDVVCDAPEGAPEVGAIAVVRGWLVGRPTVPPPDLPPDERRTWLKRLFTR